MDQVLRGFHCCYAYIDDLLIASHSPDEHKQNLRQVLECLHLHGVLINPGKCTFEATQLQFLGHQINSRPLEEKVQAVRDFP